MTVPDEEVFAFVDGELPPEDMARIEAAMATDPQLTLRIETQRALRRLLSSAHAGVGREAPSGAPGATAAARPPASQPAKIIAFPSAKAKAKPSVKPPVKPAKPAGLTGAGVPAWIGLAACLVIGLAIGRLAAPPPVTLSGADEPAPIAAGPLAQALNTQDTSQAGGPVRIALSFKTASGVYCRAFQASGRSSIAGVACREPDAWRVRAVGPAGPNQAALLASVGTLIAGPPLDADGEARAKAAGWKPAKAGAARR